MLACAKRTAGGPRATLARGWRCAISSGTVMAKVAEGGAQLSRELRLVLDALPEAVTITDAAGRLAFANAAALQRMGGRCSRRSCPADVCCAGSPRSRCCCG